MISSISQTPRAIFPLDGSTLSLGRDPGCSLVLVGAGISRRHAELVLTSPHPLVRDGGSSFGTRVNTVPVNESLLVDGDILAIGIERFVVQLENSALHLYPAPPVTTAIPVCGPDSSRTVLTLGRDSGNTIVCNHPLVSRTHATVTVADDGSAEVFDHASANGTFINGASVKHARLKAGDLVQIGPYRFAFENKNLVQAEDHNRVRIEARNLVVNRGPRKVLDRVSLTIAPGEFVVILGPSGAGKTTLAYALTGQVSAQSGSVFFNGMPLSTFASAFSHSIGFVAQHNLLHPELTVIETFREQALLRLPAVSLPAEREARVCDVLELLELSAISKRRVGHLSGGEARRVHLGIELLSSPSVVFLDEPLAGLDFGLIVRFMQLFKRIAQQGQTVLLTTHTLEHTELADRIVFVNRGRIDFEGKPGEITTAFGVSSMAEVYDRARAGSTPAAVSGVAFDEGAEGRGSLGIGDREMPLPFIRRRSARGASWIRQFLVLVARFGRIAVRDVKNVILLLAQVPIIVLLLVAVYKHDAAFFPISFYFCLAVSAIWLGGVASIREIAREWDIVHREYRMGLALSAYAASKIFVLGMVCVAQSALFWLALRLCFIDLHADWRMFALIGAGEFGGMLMALAISSLSSKQNVAVSFLPLMFMPQVFFSGILLPFDRMAVVGDLISRATIARPVFSLFKRAYFSEQSVWYMPDILGFSAVCAVLTILTLVGLRAHSARRQ